MDIPVGSLLGSNSSLSVDDDVPSFPLSTNPRGFEYTLDYATKSSAWSIERITERGGNDIALALDSKRTPHVVWAVEDAICHAWRVGAADWRIEEFVESAEPTWSMISIAIDSMDNVHVVHCYEDGLRYLFRSAAGEWDVETVDADASGPLLLYRLALVLDARGQPHIGYVAADPLSDGTRRVRYARRAGS
jgi:hypothetical protein